MLLRTLVPRMLLLGTLNCECLEPLAIVANLLPLFTHRLNVSAKAVAVSANAAAGAATADAADNAAAIAAATAAASAAAVAANALQMLQMLLRMMNAL